MQRSETAPPFSSGPSTQHLGADGGAAESRGQRSEVSEALRDGVSAPVSVHRLHSLVVDWYDGGVGVEVSTAAGQGVGCLNAGCLVAVLLQGATDSETSARLRTRSYCAFCDQSFSLFEDERDESRSGQASRAAAAASPQMESKSHIPKKHLGWVPFRMF